MYTRSFEFYQAKVSFVFDAIIFNCLSEIPVKPPARTLLGLWMGEELLWLDWRGIIRYTLHPDRLAWALFVLVFSANTVDFGLFCFINFPILSPPPPLPFAVETSGSVRQRSRRLGVGYILDHSERKVGGGIFISDLLASLVALWFFMLSQGLAYVVSGFSLCCLRV
mgnify:CR=1 FL=1